MHSSEVSGANCDASLGNVAHGSQNCPACGATIELTQEMEVARRKIFELEAQMEFLKEKATAAGRSSQHHAVVPMNKQG